MEDYKDKDFVPSDTHYVGGEGPMLGDIIELVSKNPSEWEKADGSNWINMDNSVEVGKTFKTCYIDNWVTLEGSLYRHPPGKFKLISRAAAQGKKETEGKLSYELDWRFIEAMAKRMQDNKKGKYPPYNWKKPIDIEELKQAINRHHVEVMDGVYDDGDEYLGHVVAYACNAMMLWHQLKTTNI